MKIGELARTAGVNVQTIRYYELEGLLSPRGRTESGYRIFRAEDLERIEFIKKAKRLGLSLTEIKDVLAIRGQRKPTCLHVRELLQQKVVQAEAAIRELQEFRAQLAQLIEQTDRLEDCLPAGGRICGIIEGAPLVARPGVLEGLKKRGRRSRELRDSSRKGEHENL